MNPEISRGIIKGQEPIRETPDSISYLGVRLEKAQVRNSPFVPQREQYSDYINDAFSLEMQKALAVNYLQGDPMLIEGGTSIGKTTTVRKMASELGWEVHYANLNGATDVEDLMGRYIPNPSKHSPEDPEYVFSDGKVTSGLRIEDGKVKVIILDEFNAAAPNILIRLHEVLDALGRGEHLILSEDASESVPVSKKVTKVVALMNPPGKGYFGREPLDPAQLRRWVYFKAPSELPPDTFSHATDALFSFAPQTQRAPKELFVPQRDQRLLPEQLKEIPGMEDMLAKYKEFHAAAKLLVKERRVAEDQPQQFTYDDRMEPKRVRDFILGFYNGDINQTLQTALRFYYSNKLESEVDKAQLDELIAHVEYTPPARPSILRRGLDMLGVPAETQRPVTAEAMTRVAGERSAWKNVLGADVEVKPLPDMVTPEVRRNLERLGLQLRYVPGLELNKDALRRVGPQQYLKELARRYPKWKPLEDLDYDQKSDAKITRNLEDWYWEMTKDGKIAFPSLPGQWLAVETVEKPSGYGSEYESTELARKLGFSDSRHKSWNEINQAISRQKRAILSEAGLPRGADLRLLEALEWNLLGNREGWGKTDNYEWTNTEYRESGGSDRLVVGDSDGGGAGYVRTDGPGLSRGNVGFRAAVVLGS